jgi:hypothetical protein
MEINDFKTEIDDNCKFCNKKIDHYDKTNNILTVVYECTTTVEYNMKETGYKFTNVCINEINTFIINNSNKTFKSFDDFYKFIQN